MSLSMVLTLIDQAEAKLRKVEEVLRAELNTAFDADDEVHSALTRHARHFSLDLRDLREFVATLGEAVGA